jgi:hypothetical protein
MYPTPFSFVGRDARRLQARVHGCSIAFIKYPRGVFVGHLCSRWQTEDGAQLRGEAGSVFLQIAVVNTDASNLNCQTQQLIALVCPPCWASAFDNGLRHSQPHTFNGCKLMPRSIFSDCDAKDRCRSHGAAATLVPPRPLRPSDSQRVFTPLRACCGSRSARALRTRKA